MSGTWAANHICFKPQLTTQGTGDKANFDTSQDTVDDLIGPLATAWTDYSETSTIVGWSAFAAPKVLKYKKIGSIVVVCVNLSGPSDSISTTFTLPYPAVSTGVVAMLRTLDNTVTYNIGYLSLLNSIATCYSTAAGGLWTDSNAKGIQGQFFYEVAP